MDLICNSETVKTDVGKIKINRHMTVKARYIRALQRFKILNKNIIE